MAEAIYDDGFSDELALDRGRVAAPDGPGLGIQVDWEQLDLADFYVCSKTGT